MAAILESDFLIQLGERVRAWRAEHSTTRKALAAASGVSERFLAQLKEAVKAGLHGGMMFEDLGFRYLGPIDGHNVAVLRKYLQMVKGLKGPVLLHVVTEKGHGFVPAAKDPVFFHTPPAFKQENGQPVPK